MKEEKLFSAVKSELPRIFRDKLGLQLTSLRANDQRLAGSDEGGGRHRPDLHFVLRENGETRNVWVDVKTRVYGRELSSLAAKACLLRQSASTTLLLLVAPRISTRLRKRMRALELNHADLGGSIFIKEPGLHVDVHGEQPPTWLEPNRINPFTDRASLVLRAFLADPSKTWRIGEISEFIDVTKGWVSVVVRELEKRRYVERLGRDIRLRDSVGLLKDWASFYSWDRNRVRSYVSGYDYADLVPLVADIRARSAAELALTMLAGLDFVAPHVEHEQLHVYVSTSSLELFSAQAEKLLYLERVQAGGNVHILEPFYKRAVFFGVQVIDGVPIVSNVQLFLDLIGYPVRGVEAARVLLSATLAPELQLNDAELRSLSSHVA